MPTTGNKFYHRLWWRLLGWTFPFMDPSEDPHPMVELGGIPVDEELLEIVGFLWSRGLETVNSCQGDRKLESISSQRRFYCATVGFARIEDARWFAVLIEESRTTPYVRGNLDYVQITFTVPTGQEPTYYHVEFPASLIPGLRRLIAARL